MHTNVEMITRPKYAELARSCRNLAQNAESFSFGLSPHFRHFSGYSAVPGKRKPSSQHPNASLILTIREAISLSFRQFRKRYEAATQPSAKARNERANFCGSTNGVLAPYTRARSPVKKPIVQIAILCSFCRRQNISCQKRSRRGADSESSFYILIRSKSSKSEAESSETRVQ